MARERLTWILLDPAQDIDRRRFDAYLIERADIVTQCSQKGRSPMLTDGQRQRLRDKAYDLLREVGIKVENEKITTDMLRLGCASSPGNRVRIPETVINQVVSVREKRRAAEAAVRSATPQKGQASGFRMAVFGNGPTRFYDLPNRRVVAANTDIYVQMLKFAHAASAVNYMRPWFRQDVPQPIEALDSLVIGLKHTTKMGAADAMLPEHVKYLIEIGEIVHDRPGDTTYLGGAQCMTPPLILGKRSADEMVELAQRGVKKFYVASMVTMGMTTPVTVAGAIVMGVAEILGGLVAAWSQDHEARLTGRIVTSVLDMSTGNMNYTAPEAALADIGVKEVFDAFLGGNLVAGPAYGPSAKVPGLQAVSENFWAAARFAQLAGAAVFYPGNGNLDLGGLGSPAQAILDMEIRKTLSGDQDRFTVDDEAIPFQEICERARNGASFLDSEHTLEHFRKLWSSRIFRNTSPVPGGWVGNESSILETCDRIWQNHVEAYSPPAWPADKLKALDMVLARAKRELL